MSWQFHATDRLRQDYGDDRLRRSAEWLEDVLRQNGLPIPEFPEMIWARETLPGGVDVAVGIARDAGGRLAYVWPADKVEFVGTEEMTLEDQGKGGPRSVVLRRYIPPEG